MSCSNLYSKCPPGQYVKTECNATAAAACANCKEGHYTATFNSLRSCQLCTDCTSIKDRVELSKCTTQQNTVCRCKEGFFCHNESCDHCLEVEVCPEGQGVKTKATELRDTVCEPCRNGTFSNVTDSVSTCLPHTRCVAFGKTVKTEGTPKSDAICGEFIHQTQSCHWILPAGLWAGLVLTALILFAVVVCRKAKRRSYKAEISRRNVTLVKTVELNVPTTSLDLSFVDHNGKGHCQESCPIEDFKLPLFIQDENSMDSSLPITPLKASISFAETNSINKGSAYYTGNFLRTQSEPQEDEYCGT